MFNITFQVKALLFAVPAMAQNIVTVAGGGPIGYLVLPRAKGQLV